MKYLFLMICLLPFSASAARLADCDKKSYKVTVRNGGMERTVTLTPFNGEVEEFGPEVSFQLPGQRPVSITQPDEEYCIWSGKITIQRRATLSDKHCGARPR